MLVPGCLSGGGGTRSLSGKGLFVLDDNGLVRLLAM